MRGQKGLCLICRHASRLPNAPATARRSAWTGPEPYVLSRSVIDLDAADSQFVRRVEDMTPDELAAQLRVKVRPKPIITKVPARRRIDWTSKLEWNPAAVTPPDLLAYAFHGHRDYRTIQERYKLLNTLFRRNMINSRTDAKTTIKQLNLGFTTDPTKLSAAIEGMIKIPARGAAVLGTFERFSDLERIVATLSTTQKGCRLLAYSGSAIVHSIRRSWKLQVDRQQDPLLEEIALSRALNLLNNITRAMASKGVEIGPDLCWAGLYYSAKDSVLPAVKMYLEIGRRNLYKLDWTARWAMFHLQSSLIKELPSPKWAPWLPENQRQNETLKLLTGWKIGTRPEKGRPRELSFAYLFPQSPDKQFQIDMYSTYIIGLGELGISNALWSEYRSVDMTLEDPRLKSQVFAMAFLLAKDPERALTALKSAPAGFSSRETMKNMIKYLIWQHHKFRRTSAADSVEALVEQDFPADPEKALEAIDKLLVVDFPVIHHKDGGYFTLEWGEVGGKEGLVVWSKVNGQPMYFKPLGAKITAQRK